MMVLPTPWSKPCHLAVFVVVGLWHDAPLFLCFSGNVAKCVKASPPEFCEDLECLDGLMLVIGRYFAAGSHVCEFLSPLSLFVLWVVSYVFFALSEPLSLGDGEGLRSLWGKLFFLLMKYATRCVLKTKKEKQSCSWPEHLLYIALKMYNVEYIFVESSIKWRT
jgi:hypothetical protein